MKKLIYRKEFKNTDELRNIFIPTNKEWKSTEEQNLSVIESGNEGVLFKKFIDKINSAQEMICLQSFLIQDTKIIDALLEAKQKRDVRIFIMDSAESRLNRSGFEEDESFATKDYIKMLEEKFKYNFVHRQADNLHAKFILIDPKTNPVGYIFTGNFNKKPFYHNPELAVPLSKEQIKELFKVFVYHFWEYTTDEQTASNQFDKVKPVNRFNIGSLKYILITSPNNKLSNLKKTLIDTVSIAKNEIIFSTFGFDINNELSKKILEKLKDGIKVTIFCRPREKTIINNMKVLSENGANVICHPLIHAKTLLIDKKSGYVFTANFENHGLATGFEVGTKLNENQTDDLIKIIASWENTFPYIYKHSQTVNETIKYSNLNSVNEITEIKTEEKLEKEKTITITDDLKQAISNINKPIESLAKKITIEIKLKLNEIKVPYKLVEEPIKGISVIEYEKKEKKNATQNKGILIDTSHIDLNHENLMKILNAYKARKIFAK